MLELPVFLVITLGSEPPTLGWVSALLFQPIQVFIFQQIVENPVCSIKNSPVVIT